MTGSGGEDGAAVGDVAAEEGVGVEGVAGDTL